MLTAVRRLIRTAVRRHGGHEVDARADEYFAAFASAPAALDAAVAVQRAMADGAWPDGREVHLRVGLHTGRPTLTATGYVGISVNTAARICACANGGQVVLSATTRSALGEQSAVGVRALGTHRLRGIPDQHDLFDVLAPGLPSRFPPLRDA